MTPRNSFLAHFLTLAGSLPLIVAAAGIMPVDIAMTYAAVIISFVSGVHWAAYLFFSERCSRNFFLTSVISTIIGWLSLLAPDVKIGLLMQSLCFIYLLTLDYQLKEKAIIPPWYYHLRFVITGIVVLALTYINAMH